MVGALLENGSQEIGEFGRGPSGTQARTLNALFDDRQINSHTLIVELARRGRAMNGVVKALQSVMPVMGTLRRYLWHSRMSNSGQFNSAIIRDIHSANPLAVAKLWVSPARVLATTLGTRYDFQHIGDRGACWSCSNRRSVKATKYPAWVLLSAACPKPASEWNMRHSCSHGIDFTVRQTSACWRARWII